MVGIYNEGNPNESRQPPHVLAAWMRDQLHELFGTHARRLAELRAEMQSLAFEWDAGLIAQGVTTLRSAGRELRFDNLRHGWIARRLGKHKAPHSRFAAAYDRMVDAAQRLKRETEELGGALLKSHVAGAKRALLELDMESRALQSEVERGVTWLQDMCVQINEQRQQGSADPDLASLAEAAQVYTQEYKSLESAASIVRDMKLRMQGVLDRRAALVDALRADSDKFDRDWSPAVGRIASHVDAGRTSIPGITEAVEAHDAMMRRLETVTEACAALQHEEHLMAQHLDMLRRELETRR
jgi:hypothetical protein